MTSSWMRRLARSRLLRSGLFPTALTPIDDLEALIRSLHPVQPPCGLIRLGPKTDGGYLVPNDLEGVTTCLSPGVSNESGFELDCALRGMQVLMADASVDGPATKHPSFRFRKSFVGAFDESSVMTLDSWVELDAADRPGDFLLQMDIEGAEYETLFATSSTLLRRFRIIVIELHFMNSLFCHSWFRIVRSCLRKILAGHVCVHLHPNNVHPATRVDRLSIPQTMECTFLRRDRMGPEPWSFAKTFPHPLDADNVAGATLVLPSHWHRA